MPLIQILVAVSSVSASRQLPVDANLGDDVFLLQVQTAYVGTQGEKTKALKEHPSKSHNSSASFPILQAHNSSELNLLDPTSQPSATMGNDGVNHSEDVGFVHNGVELNELPSAADAQDTSILGFHHTTENRSENRGVLHEGVLSEMKAQNASEDLGVVHKGLFSELKTQNASAPSTSNSVTEEMLEMHESNEVLSTTLDNDSEDFGFVHKESDPASEALNASVLTPHHPVTPQTHGATGLVAGEIENHSGNPGFVKQKPASEPETLNASELTSHHLAASAKFPVASPENHAGNSSFVPGSISPAQAPNASALRTYHPAGNLGFVNQKSPSAPEILNASDLTSHLFAAKALLQAATPANHTENSSFVPRPLSAVQALNGSVLRTYNHVVDAAFENHSPDLEFLHKGSLSASHAHNVTALKVHHPVVDLTLEKHTEARHYSEDIGLAHIVAPKDVASKKQSRPSASARNTDEEHGNTEDPNVIDQFAWEQQNRALDFHEHRPSSIAVASHQSGLMYNAWLVSRVGFGVVVGMTVALMWLLQCSRLCTRSAATPIPRENFDQQVLADVYKVALSSKLHHGRSPTSPQEKYDQISNHLLADVYQAARSRPRVHTPTLAETVAESSRVLRWVASKRSKQTAAQTDEAANHFKAKNAAKRWYDS